MARRAKEGSLARLGVAVLAMLAILAIATRLSPGPGLLVLGLGVAFLGFAAWKWGYDSRSPGDWKKR